MSDWISVRGAREHNLKNIDVQIPRDKLVVITGLSGSGKSTLAFDTIFAEGQRRYVESLSAYARQFLGQLEKPDVDSIDGLSPAIAIDQKGASRNPRSTVGTITEIYDFLRLLFARVGRPHCPQCGRPLARQTPQQMVDAILGLPDGSRILLLAPLVRERKGEHQKVLDDARKAGFVRARINGDVRELDEEIKLEKYREHTIEVVVDRLVVRHRTQKAEGRRQNDEPSAPQNDERGTVNAEPNAGTSESQPPAGGNSDTSAFSLQPSALTDHPDRVRVADSVETALKLGGGALLVQVVGGDELTFSQQYACPVHGAVNLLALEPRDFSFNSPQGACPTCGGLGTVQELDPDLLLDPELSLAAGAVLPWARAAKADRRSYDELIASLAEHKVFSVDTPVRELPPDVVTTIVYGSQGEVMPLRFRVRGELRTTQSPFEGVLPTLRRRLGSADEAEREQLAQYTTPRTCPTCDGARLRPALLAVTVAGGNIAHVASLPVGEALRWVDGLITDKETRRQGFVASAQPSGDKELGMGKAEAFAQNLPLPNQGIANASAQQFPPLPLSLSDALTPREATIASPILREIRSRLSFLLDVGLSYLALNRPATTLSGGEAQRIRLATQVGAGLQGVLYILDEPSIGLHPRDHGRLLATLLRLRDIGNSVLVVEHDEETIRAADWIVDIGPGAGEGGGELIASGPLEAVMNAPRSITGQFLSGQRRIAVPAQRRSGNGAALELRGARANNLQSVDVIFPLGTFICVTGVSGGGKSTLVNDTLAARLAQLLYGARARPGEHDALRGVEHIDKAITIDQSAIGRTPRSNPATYTKVFDPIRQLFAATNEAKARGYDASRFSFNLKGGRCEACNGEGMVQIEMQFLPDLYVPCEVCGGTRYNRETLDVRYRGVNIAEVLDMTVDDATRFFERVPAIHEKLATLLDVGLGYLRLGQPATTLSGGEAQRIKLASELSRRATGRTLYILDEPTTGLHFADVERLLQVLQRLVASGNTVLVIEHNLDVIKSADWLIDMGPEGGGGGGRVVAEGTPEQVAQHPASRTGPYLRAALGIV